MLRIMRDRFHQLKWILLAIVAAFIIGFVYFDMGLGGGSTSGQQDRGYAARVNGSTITYRDYDRALYYTEKNYEQMYRQPLSAEMLAAMGINKQVIDGLVDQQLMLQEAKNLHLTATPEEVRRKVLEIPALNPDGKFVGTELYTRWVTTQLGFTSPAEFEDELAREITLQKMESALTNSVVVSPKAAEAEYRRITENAKIRYVMMPAARQAAAVTITPADVDAFYKANTAKYAHGEQRAIKYLVADVARIRSQINPSEQELRRRYDASKEDYKKQESAHILHVLIKVNPGAAPADDAAARAKAESIVAQLRAGADFGKLAKENSGDPSSAGNGGDMGFVDKGTTVQPFDEAAFSIPLNTISDPIRSQEFGYHIIKVLERKPAAYQTFDEVRPQLASQAADQMAKDQARDEVTRIAQVMKQNPPKTAEQFSKFANERVSSNDSQWFAKGDQIPGLGNNAALAQWVFSAKVNDVGDVIGTSRGPAIPFVYGDRPAGVTALAEIRPRVEADARMAKARELATQALQQAMPAPNVDAVAAKVGLSAADTTVSRQGFIAGFNGDTEALVNAAMTANVGEIKGPVPVADGAVVFQVTEQKKVDPKAVNENTAQYSDMLRQQQARELRTALLQRLRKEAKIEVNPKVLEQPTSSRNGGGSAPAGM